MNIQHLPCVAIIVAVCAVVLCVALSLARKVNFGRVAAGSSRGNDGGRTSVDWPCPGPGRSRAIREAGSKPVASTNFGAGSSDSSDDRHFRQSDRGDLPAPSLTRPTRTIPNEQAKRRAMWAKIVRKM